MTYNRVFSKAKTQKGGYLRRLVAMIRQREYQQGTEAAIFGYHSEKAKRTRKWISILSAKFQDFAETI